MAGQRRDRFPTGILVPGGFLCVMGVALVLVSPVLDQYYRLLSLAVRDLGIAAIGGGAVSIVTELVLVRSVAQQVIERIRQDFADAMDPVATRLEGSEEKLSQVSGSIKETSEGIGELVTTGLTIIKAAEYSSIAMILPPRSRARIAGFPDPQFPVVEWTRAVESEIRSGHDRQPNLIRVAGRSVRDFFKDTGLLWQLVNEQVKDHVTKKVHVKYNVLLANPYSREGERICQQEGTPPELLSETALCIARIVKLRKQAASASTTGVVGSFSVNAKIYCCGIVCSMIASENSVFVEQYHLGHWPGYTEGCTGGLVPGLCYGRTDDPGKVRVYDQMVSHFDFLWKHRDMVPIEGFEEIAEVSEIIGRAAQGEALAIADYSVLETRIGDHLKEQAGSLCNLKPSANAASEAGPVGVRNP